MRYEYKDGMKRLYVEKDSREQIREDLTFNNPAYEQVMRFSKWGSTKVPKFLKYYSETKDYIDVPMGYEVEGECIADDRNDFSIEYPNFMLTLRPIQELAIKDFKETGILVLPTGSGKSLTGAYLAQKLKQNALVVVNKDDLIVGWTKDLKQCFGEEFEIGLVKGKVFKLGKITLTTIQTLSKLGEDKLNKVRNHVSMIIIDECHRCGARSYQILNSFPTKYRLGLTATKMRNDGLADVLDLLCGKTVFDGTNIETDAIISARDIHIVRRYSTLFWKPHKNYYYVYSKRTVEDVHLDKKVIKKNSFEWRNLMQEWLRDGKIMEYPLRLHEAYHLIGTDLMFNKQICKDIIAEYNEEKSCVVFCKTVEQLELLYNLLLPHCPRIQKFYGSMAEDKETIINRAESKEVLVTLATISISTEGTNIKSWERGFLASSVANEKDLIQILGRLRRTKAGKKDVKFYDYRHEGITAVNRHGVKRDEWYKNLGIFS